ncbi:MAG: HAMP domain-containing histidine kinase [Oscillospiraceae bacterium]|jgi:hypothetical protein|nr:HAMP domain-containing histidine kinase [Oscillospiraceae bacterium]
MLKRLKIKIIAVVLGTLLLVFAAVLLVLNLSAYQRSVKRPEVFMESVLDSGGFPIPQRGKTGSGRDARGRSAADDPEFMRAGRFFYATVDKSGAVIGLNLDMMFDFTPEDARSYIAKAEASEKMRGGVENFLFMAADKPYGRMYVFSERSIETGILDHLTRASLWAAGIVCVVLSCLAAFLANWIVAPVKGAFDKQRRFISDASHEFLTPLTIIGTNVDVLQNEIGENRRLAHIRAQTERMGGLVRDLLELARADEGRPGTVMCGFDLSAAVLGTALEFESRAFEEGKRYTCDVTDGITYVGDEGQVRRLVSVLIDNAIAYSDEGGRIEVSLRPEGNRPRLSVFNTGVGVPQGERRKIFERFYRSDASRSRETGGYGVGLSIAACAAEAHNAKITVSGEHGRWIRFEVLFPPVVNAALTGTAGGARRGAGGYL